MMVVQGAVPAEGREEGREESRTVTLTDTPDIVATIGRPGLLEHRAGAASITRIHSMRSDALLAHVKESGIARGALIVSLYSDLFAEEHLQPSQTLDNLAELSRLLSEQDTQLFVYNVSTYDPDVRIHNYTDQPDTYAIRAHRLLAGLENAAGDAGIIVIDVDGAVAEVGGQNTVTSSGHLAGVAAEFVTEEAVMAIDQSGALGGTLQAPVMRLVVPSFDRRTKAGTIARWHVAPGASVGNGDALFDVRFETRVHRFDMGHDDENRSPGRFSGRSKKADRVRLMDVTVVAGSDAFLHEITLHDGARVSTGDVAGIVTTSPGIEVGADEAESDFRVGAKTID